VKQSFADAVESAMRKDKSVMLLTGDLGYGFVEDLAACFPGRVLNCGIAEQTMAGIAAGLAKDGYKPIVYSIGNFAGLRCAEQIRNDISAPGLSVLIVAAGGGFTYGSAGSTHHATEDLSFFRSLRQMAILTPALEGDLCPMVHSWLAEPGPTYLRLDRGVTLSNSVGIKTFEPRRWRVVADGSGIGIFTLGSCLEVGLKLRSQYLTRAPQSRLIDCNQLSPLDAGDIDEVLADLHTALTIEEHSINGGLGSLVAEAIAENGAPTRLIRSGISNPIPPVSGSPSFLRQLVGIDAGQLEARLTRALLLKPDPEL
jgi:transketolase